MNAYRLRLFLVALPAALGLGAPARAQWAVVDAPAIAQLIQEVQALEQQIEIARTQLQTAQQEFQAITGDRGMEALAPGAPRNYLPTNWAQLSALASGNGGSEFGGLSGEVRAAIAADAVLPAQRMANLAPDEQRMLESSRQWIAIQGVLAQTALANSSERFASLQTLISALSGAKDTKATLDLQARIGAEIGMLQNENIKLQVLDKATLAQNALSQQQAREYILLGHGQFESRFRPTPR